MELLIDVEVPLASPHPRLEVQVDLEPEVSVSDLVAGLRDYVTARGVGPLPQADELTAVAEPGDRTLHPDDSIGATRLVSGETVLLKRSPRTQGSSTPPPAGPASDVQTFAPGQPGFGQGQPPYPPQPPQPPQPPPPPAGMPPPGQAPSPRHLAPPGGMHPGQPPPPGPQGAHLAPPPPPPPPARAPGAPPATSSDGWQPKVKLPTQRQPEPQQQPKPTQAIAVDVSTGPSAGVSKLLQPGSYAIGRGKACSIRLDDPTVSRLHLMVEVAEDLSVQVHADPGSTNGTWVDGEYLGGTRQVEPGQRIVIGATELSFWPVAPEESRIQDRLGRIPFNRVPYKRPVVQERPFDSLDNPPTKAEPRKVPYLVSLLPLVAALAMWYFTGRWFMLLFAGMSPIMMIARARSKKKEGNLKYRRQREEFLEQLDRRVNEIDQALADERRERFVAAPDVAELARQAELHQPRLWERHRATADLLSLRFGLGDQKSLITQGMVKDGDMELRERAAERLAHHNTVPHAPVVADLDELGATGLFHDYGQVTALGAALVTQAACLHSPEDLVIAAAVSPESLPSWAWLKWLPHTRTATSPLEGDHLVTGSDDLNRLMTNLLKVAAARFENGKPPPGSGGFWPRVLIMIEEDADPDRAILAQLLDVAPAAGIRLLWLGRTEFQLPRQCQGIVRCVAPQQGLSTLRYTDPEIPDQHLMLEGITPQTALGIAKRLAPIRDASATSLTTAIPRKVLLLDAMAMPEPSRHEVVGRWAQPRGYSLEFPLGVGADGQFTLDMVEHGPHALIAGTSGAGKSELLQSMVAALAANYPPERLNFLFIDYKGGAAAAPFEPLPHTVGAVTNLEAQLSMRALTSLRAELNRRMGVMEGRAKDLSEMLEVAPEETPPSLVIVVDEFATLVKEIPDFVAGMVDIAQRGRSLGIHLVLATQRPTGAVNDNILANTNLRMSLRVLDPADSSSIIGTRDAADIPVPLRGRAYARSGPGAINPFQCAYSGAPFQRKQVAAAVTVSPFPFGSHKGETDEPKPAQPTQPATPSTQPSAAGEDEQAPPTHLEVVVNACAEAARALDKPPPRRPWVEPLPEVVLLDDVLDQLGPNVQSDPGRYAILGLADQPEAQSQRPEIVDLESSGGLLVFGTGGAGKTTALRTVAAGMAAQGDPDAVELYGLDFAGRSLKQLSDLPHTVAVATSDDLELITRMFTVLREEIESRRELLAEHRAESLSALRRATGGVVVPRKIVFLDGYSNFHSTFDKSGDLFAWLQILQKLMADGRQVGIHGVFSTDRRQGLPSSLFSAMGARLALRMSTPEELAQAGVPSKVAKEVNLADGRGYLNGTVELQVACVSEDPGGAAQAEALHLLGKRVVERSSALPTTLPELPESVTLTPGGINPLISRPMEPTGRLGFPLGVTDLTLDAVRVDLSRQNLVVTGPPMSGRSTALAQAAIGLAAAPDAPALVAIGGSASPLAELPVWTHSGFSRTQVVPTLEAAVELVGDEESTEVKLVLFIDAMEDVDGQDRAKLLDKLAKSDQVRLAVAGELMTLSKAYSGWAAELRRNRAVMVFQPGKGEVEQLTGMKPSLRPGQPMPAGRGVLVADRRWRLIQVSEPSELAN